MGHSPFNNLKEDTRAIGNPRKTVFDGVQLFIRICVVQTNI